MAGISVNNNLKALTNIVNRAADVSGQNAYANAPYAEEDALQDTFNMVMNRISAQTDTTKADNGANAQTQSKAAAKAPDTNAAGNKAAAGSKTTLTGSKAMSAGIAADSGSKTVKSDTASDASTVKNADNAAKTANADEETAKAESAQTSETVEDEVSETAQDAMKEAGEKLVEEIAEEMDVTPEEVEEVMAMLGLDAVQLLNPENMKQLLVALSGNEDQLAIVTDAELYGHLQNLLDTVEESLTALQEELGLTEDELFTLIADMAVVETPPEETDVSETLPVQTGLTDDVPLEGMKDYAVTVHKDGESVEVKVTVNDADGSKSVQEQVTAANETQPKQEAKSGNRNTSGEGKNEGNAAGSFIMPNTVEQPAPMETVIGQPVMERFVSTQDIMNQIMEYMKINLKGDVQELELQLHPASLGNVNVQIAAKEGAITAQFTAQNDVVKAAIESQLIQLKEQFEEQGIKVDAVEVTVAEHRFEENFSGNEEKAGEERKNGSKSRRKINLNELDLEELPEDMEDSERIAAEMMAASGNTVDYTA